MRKSQTIPKICAAAIFLIIALIISAPVFSVTFNKVLGGGTLEFGTAGSVEYRENRPIEGELFYIIGCTSGDSESASDFTLKNGSYYYLVTTKGKTPSKDGANEVVLVKTLSNKESYENLNNLWRNSSKGDAKESFLLSGVVKKGFSDEEKIAEEIIKNSSVGDVTYIDYVIDCTTPVSAFINRFLLSLIFYAGFVVSLMIVIQAFKRNRNIDDIEHHRAITQAVQDVKSGNNNPDGTDAMFGDSDRSFAADNTQYQGQSQQAAVSYQGGTQYQGEQQYQGSQNNRSDDDYDGFFGS